MARKRAKSEANSKKSGSASEAEPLVNLEEELEPEELESLEEEFEGESEIMDEDLAKRVGSAAEAAAASEVVADESGGSVEAFDDSNGDLDDEEIEPFEDFEEEIEQPRRRETRQELLGRLMNQLLDERDKVHQALERVRDLKMQLDDAGARPPEKLRDQYHKAVTDLSRARRGENFARAELMQVLSWRG